MPNERGTDAFVNFLAVLIKAAPRDLPDEVYLWWTENGEGLTNMLRAAITRQPQVGPPTPTPQPPYEQICISFELGCRKFEAVSFLKRGETSVTGDTMIERTDKDDMVVGSEDWAFVYEHRHELPLELRSYHLATKRRGFGGPRVSYLFWNSRVWCSRWLRLARQLKPGLLVLRRRA